MKAIYALLLIVIASLFFNCKNNKESHSTKLSSLEIANSLILHCDSNMNEFLFDENLNYNNVLLAQTIDKLGHIDTKYSKLLEEIIDEYVNDDGTILFIDSLGNNYYPAINLITLYKRTGEAKYKTAIEKKIKNISDEYQTFEMDSFSNNNYFDKICVLNVFLAQYAKEFNEHYWYDFVSDDLIKLYEEKDSFCDNSMTDNNNFKKEMNEKMGKYAISLIGTLDYLPKNHSNYQSLIKILNSIIESVVDEQKNNEALWSFDNSNKIDEDVIDISSSLMYLYVIAKASNNRYLPEHYFDLSVNHFEKIKLYFELDNNGCVIIPRFIEEDKIPLTLAVFLMTAIELNN